MAPWPATAGKALITCERDQVQLQAPGRNHPVGIGDGEPATFGALIEIVADGWAVRDAHALAIFTCGSERSDA